MSNMYDQVDAFGVSVPAPMEPFTSVIIHPRNIAIQERQENARRLTRAQLVEVTKKAEADRRALDEASYFAMLADYKLLKKRFELYLRELAELPEGSEDRTDKEATIARVREEGIALSQSLKALEPIAVRYQLYTGQLKDHRLAVERDQAHDRLNKQMLKEAYRWEEIIIETWTRLGYCHVGYDKRGKKFTHKVKMSEMMITPDAVWYKIFVTVRLLFGSRSALPKGVHVRDLTDDKTLEELSIACQRQVTAEVGYSTGAWIKVNRIGTTDGLLNYVTLEQVLNSYPHDQRDSFPLPLGVGEGRNISWIMLAEHPHFLIAGSTGNGKSNITTAHICTLIQHHSPDELGMCFIDLKDGAEFAAFADVPHALMPVVKTVEEAVNVLAQMEALRADRMKQIAAAGCKNIIEFNQRFPRQKLPRIVIFIDEYARIKARGTEFERVADRSVGEITALGRAAGIHLYAATQTPYARILPGEAKNNMAMRMAFALPSVEGSKSIVGNGDAFNLPQGIKGRGIAAVGSTRWQVQTPHCREVDTERSLEIGMNWKPRAVEVFIPKTVQIDVFDEQEMLDIAINELGGNLGAKPIFDYVKVAGTATLSEVREMVKSFTRTHKEVEFEGELYQVKKHGTAWRLVAQKNGKTKEQDTTEDSSGVFSSVISDDDEVTEPVEEVS